MKRGATILLALAGLLGMACTPGAEDPLGEPTPPQLATPVPATETHPPDPVVPMPPEEPGTPPPALPPSPGPTMGP
jgi:hypothetical protein